MLMRKSDLHKSLFRYLMSLFNVAGVVGSFSFACDVHVEGEGEAGAG